NRIDAAIAIVVRAGLVLICQRKADDTFGGLWEFPGGKQEEGETLEECLARELREELNITARLILRLPPIEHDYPELQIRLHPFVCEHEFGDPELLECQCARWIDPSELSAYEFPSANGELIERVMRHLIDRDLHE